MKNSKLVLLLIAVFALPLFATAGEINRELAAFTRIIASPRINVILSHGEQESIRLVYDHVSADDIRIELKGKTLRIYLKDARVTEKLERVNDHEKRSIYVDAIITAYVTYKDLSHLEIRGNQELTCKDPLTAEKFTLKAYGENEINLSSLKAGYLKTHLYGENKLKIKGGKADYQKYKLYGENKIDTRELKSYSATATIFGESNVKLNIQDELRVNSFGEAEVAYNGAAHVNRGLIFGRTEIRKLD
jgi:hypothetical protein